MTTLRPPLALIAIAACAAAAVPAQHVFGQAPGSRSYNVGSFDGVAAAGPNLVVVHLGGAPAVSAQGPSETLDKMEVVVEHGSLQIRPREQYRNSFDWNEMKRATFTVTAPRLSAASLAGSGEMRVERAAGDRFTASVAGSGKMEIAALQVDHAHLSTAGTGTLTAHGNVRRADVSVAGSGSVHAHDVASRMASVSIAGSGNADLTAEDTANISIVGSGNADIAGRSHCTVSRIGSGKAHCNA